MSENLKRILREEIESYEASLMTTPHLSKIHHAEVALLALLEEGVRPVILDKPGAPQASAAGRPLSDP